MTHLVVTWERPYFRIDEQPFIPVIFSGADGVPMPSGFNVRRISVDGRMRSDLNWAEASAAAQKAVDEGHTIFWDLDLGLFGELPLPLTDQSQFMSLGLSIEHFLDNLWQKYREHTFGLCIFRGSAQFANALSWSDDEQQRLGEWLTKHKLGTSEVSYRSLVHEKNGRLLLNLFARDVVAAYLGLLVDRLPEAIEAFALVDAGGIRSPFHQALLLHKERFSRIHLGVKGSRLPFQGLVWEDSAAISGFIGESMPCFKEVPEATMGVCLPSADIICPSMYVALEEVVASLSQAKVPFRIVPEDTLTAEWDGLDTLIVNRKALADQGERKLLGFQAAGGAIVDAYQYQSLLALSKNA